jgi:hypothetical protein
MLSTVPQHDNYDKLHFTQDGGHRHILRFLFVRGSTTTLIVGGLGVDDQQNCLRVISKRNFTNQNLEHNMNWKQQIPSSFFPLPLLTS